MAVEPSQRLGNAAEDDLMGDELVNFVDIEAVLGRRVKRPEETGHLGGHGASSFAVELPGNQNRNQRDDHAGNRHLHIQMDDIGGPGAADELAERDESCHHGDQGQEYERAGHVLGRFVQRMLVLGRFAPEDIVVKPEHVESGQGGNEGHDHAQPRLEHESSRQDFVLAEESGERGDAGDSQAGYQEGDMRDRHLLAQASHPAHLVAMHGMDDGTGTEEEQGFEHGVGEEVEHRSHITEAFVAFQSVGFHRSHAGNA